MQSVETNISEQKAVQEPPKKKRGRPKKIQDNLQEIQSNEPKRKRGRPRKVQETVEEEKEQENIQDEEEPVDLFNLGIDDDSKNGGLILPGLEKESSTEEMIQNNQENSEINLFDLADEQEEENVSDFNVQQHTYSQYNCKLWPHVSNKNIFI